MNVRCYIAWTWLHGETVGDQHSNDVEILLSDETPSNAASKKHGFLYPGSRAGATWWTNESGTVWMFGGQGFDDKPTNDPRMLNDLWEFQTSKQTWKLVDDAGPANTETDSNNKGPLPKPRKFAASCGVQSLAFVVFGGEDGKGQVFSDTWVYDVPQSEWLVLHFAPKLPVPPGRKDMAYWCTHGKLIIFGGLDSHGNSFDDMWEFSLSALIWRRIAQNQGDVNNTLSAPVGRGGATTWMAHNMSLYMASGYRQAPGMKNRTIGLGDMWVYMYKRHTWKLLCDCNARNSDNASVARTNGEVFRGTTGVIYGTLGEPHPRNCPGARRHASPWVDIHGDLWLFGGELLQFIPKSNLSTLPATFTSLVAETHGIYGSLLLLADLWKFEIEKSQWVWMGGAKCGQVGPVYGTFYQPSSTNHPSSRSQTITWAGKGTMFLYGGIGLDARNKIVFLNDVWLMLPKNLTSFLKERDWFHRLPASTIFMVTLATFGGIVLAFGTGFYLKKMLESPNHNPGGDFRVKYSRVKQEPSLEA